MRRITPAVLSIVAITLLMSLLVSAQGPNPAEPTPDAATDTWVANGPVWAIEGNEHAVYLGGNFSFVGPATGHAVRLNPETTIAPTPEYKPGFQNFPSVNGAVYACIPDGDGGWYIGGDFTAVLHPVDGNIPRNRLARVLADGTVDSAFDPNVNRTVYALALDESWDLLYVGGRFTRVHGTAARREYLCAINADTTSSDYGRVTDWLAPTEEVPYPGPDDYVRAMLLSEDDQTLYIGGNFTNIGAVSRRHIAAFQIDLGATEPEGEDEPEAPLYGEVMPNWIPNANHAVHVMVWGPKPEDSEDAPSRLIYVGGWFTSIGYASRSYIAAIEADPTTIGLANDWNPGANDPVFALAVTEDGKTVYAGGSFTQTGGEPRQFIAALGATPHDDPTVEADTPRFGMALDWDPRADDWTTVLGLSPLNAYDDILYVGGRFKHIGKPLQLDPLDQAARHNIAALIIDAGSTHYGRAAGWNPGAGNAPRVILPPPDGGSDAVLVAGEFTTVNGEARNNLAAFGADPNKSHFRTANEWNPDADNAVLALRVAPLPETVSVPASEIRYQVYVGGVFNAVGGESRMHLAAINADHTDPNYPANYGKVLNWAPHATRTDALPAIVHALVLTPDKTRLYAGGAFTEIRSVTRNRIAEFDRTAQGTFNSLPTALAPAPLPPDAIIYDLAASNHTLYAGGRWVETTAPYYERGFIRANRTRAQGYVWETANIDAPVLALALYDHGGHTDANALLHVGGHFTRIMGANRHYLTVLRANMPMLWTGANWQHLGLDGSVHSLYMFNPARVLFVGGNFKECTALATPPDNRRHRVMELDANPASPTFGLPYDWNPKADNPVYDFEVERSPLAGDSLYMGGAFFTLRCETNDTRGRSRSHFARFPLNIPPTLPDVGRVTVVDGWRVNVTFSKAMGANALAPTNYTVSGTGIGALNNNPDTVVLLSDPDVNTYQLMWNCPDNIMRHGGDITITVDQNVMDEDGNTMGFPREGTHESGAIAEMPVITVLGDLESTVNIGQPYADDGAEAYDACGTDISAAIFTTGVGFDTSVVGGPYLVRYNVNDGAGNLAQEKTRTVWVVDPTLPYVDNVEVEDQHHILVTFSRPMGAGATDENNYTLSGSGQGTFSPHPLFVTQMNPREYRLSWSCLAGHLMYDGGDIVITVDETVQSNLGDLMSAPMTRTHFGGARANAPIITLLGAATETIPCGSPYTVPGANASDGCGANITGAVEVGGDALDVNTPGTYQITYNVRDAAQNPAVEALRVITVEDITPPVITLSGGTTVMECGDSFNEPGATAQDECDGDISHRIIIDDAALNANVPGTYTVLYNVSDSSGNVATPMSREVIVEDNLPPVITILGAVEAIVSLGDVYEDAGATAWDACDGDLTNAIVVGGIVNTDAIGTYPVRYNVSDSAGNAAEEKIRTVHVVDPDTSYVVNVVVLDGWTVDVAFSKVMSDEALAPAHYTLSGTGQGTLNIHPASVARLPEPNDHIHRLQWNCPEIMLHGGDIRITVADVVEDEAGNPLVEPMTGVHVGGAVAQAPRITLVGADLIPVECGDTFADPGVEAQDACLNGLTVVVGGDVVDTSEIGVYTITYDVSDLAGNAADQVIREVFVEDSVAPVITLQGDPVIEVECGAAFTDPGVIISDMCEGDLSDDVVVTGAVDTSQVGTYILAYNVSDSALNDAVEVTRTVNVVDETPPLITLLGYNPHVVECGDIYIEPGVTAWDICDGDLTDLIEVGGNTVYVNAVADYLITYDVRDTEGNAAETKVRTVSVVDTTPPVVTITGGDTLTGECGVTLTLPDADVDDLCDAGPLSAYITDYDGLNVSHPASGVYEVVYEATDVSGNTGTATLTVTIEDTTPPVVTIDNGDPLLGECGVALTLPGATALDECDGPLAAAITDFDGLTPDNPDSGLYTVVYSATDAAGNTGTASLTVTIEDTTPPVILLLGNDPFELECGVAYVDPGARLWDICDGDIDAEIVIDASGVNTTTVGTYTVNYSTTATDNAGLGAAPATRTVNVVDNLSPEIQLLGDNPLTIECGESYVSPGAELRDQCDGLISAVMNVDDSGLDTGVVGVYTVTYSTTETDSAGNAPAPVMRTVFVEDHTPPLLQIDVFEPFRYDGEGFLLHECSVLFTEPSTFSAVDLCMGDLGFPLYELPAGTPGVVAYAWVLDNAGVPLWDGSNPMLRRYDEFINLKGDYLLIYEAHDGNGNVYPPLDVDDIPVGLFDGGGNPIFLDGGGNLLVDFARLTRVVDTQQPTITLLGDAWMTVECGVPLVDTGATAWDDCDGDLTGDIVTAVAGNTEVVGSYIIAYSVTDSAGNASPTELRTVTVEDTIAPVISLIGPNLFPVYQGATYVDPGAEAWDQCDGDLTAAIVISGDVVDTSILGDYIVRYNVSDLTGNAALEVTRIVSVVPSASPTLTITGDNPLFVECGASFTDPGATANDGVDGNLTAQITVSGTVNTATPGDYPLEYSVTNSGGHTTADTRIVRVRDTQPPIIALLGDDPFILECATPYGDPGAIIWDQCDGLIAGVVDNDASSAVNTAILGIYVVTYTTLATDAEGHPAQDEQRTVEVVDTTPPTLHIGEFDIFAPWEIPFLLHECGDAFNEPDDFHAWDACMGLVGDEVVDELTPGLPGIIASAWVLDVNGRPVWIGPLEDRNPMRYAYDVFVGIPGDYLVLYEAHDGNGNVYPPRMPDGLPNIVDGAGNLTIVDGGGELLPGVDYARLVRVKDTIAPTIDIDSGYVLIVECADDLLPPEWPTDPATAWDACDGDLSSAIVRDRSAIDVSQPGNYQITFTVLDSAGNVAVPVTRPVQVVDTTPPVINLGTWPGAIVDGFAIHPCLPDLPEMTDFIIYDECGPDFLVRQPTSPVPPPMPPAAPGYVVYAWELDAARNPVWLDFDNRIPRLQSYEMFTVIPGNHLLYYVAIDSAGNIHPPLDADNLPPVVDPMGNPIFMDGINLRPEINFARLIRVEGCKKMAESPLNLAKALLGRFNEFDVNGDGMLDESELLLAHAQLQALYPDLDEETFRRHVSYMREGADALDAASLEAFIEAHEAPCDPDATPPVVGVNDITLELDASRQVSLFDATALYGTRAIAYLYDNCLGDGVERLDLFNITASQDSFGCADVGTRTITLFVADDAGNIAERPLEVVITDTLGACAASVEGEGESDEGEGESDEGEGEQLEGEAPVEGETPDEGEGEEEGEPGRCGCSRCDRGGTGKDLKSVLGDWLLIGLSLLMLTLLSGVYKLNR